MKRSQASKLFLLLVFLLIFNTGAFAFEGRIKELSKKNGVNPEIALLIAKAESSLNVCAIGSLGERGLYQITEDNWYWITPKLYGKVLSYEMAFVPEYNIEVAMWLLRWLKEQLGDHYSDKLLIVSYNAGIGNIKKSGYSIPSWYKTNNKIYNRILNDK